MAVNIVQNGCGKHTRFCGVCRCGQRIFFGRSARLVPCCRMCACRAALRQPRPQARGRHIGWLHFNHVYRAESLGGSGSWSRYHARSARTNDLGGPVLQIKCIAGPPGDRQIDQIKQGAPVTPGRQIQKLVGPEQQAQRGVRAKFGAQLARSVDGVADATASDLALIDAKTRGRYRRHRCTCRC